ncbi:MAG: hypothetical protein RIA65_06395 [Woeseia sp.]
MRYRLSLALLFLAGASQAAEVDILRAAPPTGIYLETDYRHPNSSRCDWYYTAKDFLLETVVVSELPCPVIVRLRGILSRQGALLFSQVSQRLADWPAEVTRVVLNSRGGDSTAAFQIARIIREHDVYQRHSPGVTTALDESETAVCFSACLIVFAAGFERYAVFDEYNDPALPSRLGIHRPGQYNSARGRYDSSDDNRYIRVVRRQLTDFFDSVGVSSQLVDEMFAVPFDDIRLLTETEARDFGLVTRDQP